MNGSLDLVLAPVGGVTRPTHLVAVPPLQCSRARYDDPGRPGAASLTLLHLGGVLQGDRLDLAIRLEAGAAATITTAAATQVYRMPERDAAQMLAVTLSAGALLRYLPEPTILFAESRFTQTTRITLHDGARLVLRDILVGGRLARGELHQYERYASRLEVYHSDGRCLLAERALLEPTHRSPAALGVQGSYPVVGSLYLLGHVHDRAAAIARIGASLDSRGDLLADVGDLPNGCGLLVRALASSPSAVRAAFDAALCASHVVLQL